ncbi:MAG TPA: phage holin family protein [Marmoricola sp.]|nr:phage holin family protein [Marmoricola sp.]HNJ79272.1 phage holin family protein [Marmoricola sp.]HNN47977.1 phage holin family protein [Marmoricola sp.]HNO39634.1 phage holin family protein [Marmoricola sp.]
MAEQTPVQQDGEPTIGKLVVDATQDISKLIQYEIQLAKSELKVSLRNGGAGAVLFVAAGFLLVLGLILFSVAMAYFISMTGLHLAWCFLIVWAAYTLLALLLALIGFTRVKKVRAPQKAINQALATKERLTNR